MFHAFSAGHLITPAVVADAAAATVDVDVEDAEGQLLHLLVTRLSQHPLLFLFQPQTHGDPLHRRRML